MTQNDQKPQDEMKNILNFLNAPEDEHVINIDCSDCDQLAALAEDVANGKSVEDVLPALADHLHYWRDCREEFHALVAVLKAEDDGSLSAALDEISNQVLKQDKKEE